MPISAAKNQLSELVESAHVTSEEFTITVNGVPAAMLVGVDEWESLNETLFWMSQPGIKEDIAEAKQSQKVQAGLDEAAVRQRHGL